MISVRAAQAAILAHPLQTGTFEVASSASLGMVLGQKIVADRDLPAFNRATMDGIAINYRAYRAGRRTFTVAGVQAAGQPPAAIKQDDECIQIMTGAALDKSVDAVIPIEEIELEQGEAQGQGQRQRRGEAQVLSRSVSPRQFVHARGSDAKKGATLVKPGQVITPDILAVLASVGKTKVKVYKPPKIAIISTGDELLPPESAAKAYKIRSSNDQAIRGILGRYHIDPEVMHVNDDASHIRRVIKQALSKYDVVIISGGVSKGRFDYVQNVLDELAVKKLFHGVKQKPGKPLWFGLAGQTPVFALPGNPLSVYVCMTRYVVPWLNKSFGIKREAVHAVLDRDVAKNPALAYFCLVKTSFDKDGSFIAKPLIANTSGDFISLVDANALIELPAGDAAGKKGERYRIWIYKDEIM